MELAPSTKISMKKYLDMIKVLVSKLVQLGFVLIPFQQLGVVKSEFPSPVHLTCTVPTASVIHLRPEVLKMWVGFGEVHMA